jgi:hypothetical protein
MSMHGATAWRPVSVAWGWTCAGIVALGLTIVVGAQSGSSPSQGEAGPCAVETGERVVAIGDVHGAYDRFVEILRHAGLVDGRQRWSGGRAVLVQTGDLLDRGPDSRRVLDLLRRLEDQAARAGGQVHVLLGNHEVMRLTGDWRYVSAREYAAFRNTESEALRERVYRVVAEREAQAARDDNRRHDEAAFRRQFFADVPLGFIEMRLAFEHDGPYGEWLRTRPVVVRINRIAFLHGGLSEEVALLGCERINETIRGELAGPAPPPDRLGELLATGEHGPLWYRGLALEPEDEFAPVVDTILARMDASAIVMGHTPVPGRVVLRFGGRVLLIDTGMLGGEFYPGGVASALEFHGDAVTAIYTNRRERLSAH